MKVLYLTCIPAPYKVNFLNELNKLCDLTVIFEREYASDRDSSWKKGNIYKFKYTYLKGVKYSNDSSLSLGVIKHLRNNTYDYIVFGVYHTATAMITMQFLKTKHKPFILSSDGGFVKSDSKLMFKIKKHFISMAEYYLSPGGETDRYLKHYGARKERIYHYPFTSVSESKILKSVISFEEKLEIKKKLGMKEKCIILSVGQFIPRKGFDLLIEAFKKMNSNYGLYIVGGVPTQEYMSIAKSTGKISQIHFVPFVKADELENYYLAADVFAFPTREDIWGLVVVEALSKGLPVITTDKCNAGCELIKNGYNGWLIKSENVVELSEAVFKTFSGKVEKMRRNALESVREYSYENMARAHFTAFLRMEDMK